MAEQAAPARKRRKAAQPEPSAPAPTTPSADPVAAEIAELKALIADLGRQVLELKAASTAPPAEPIQEGLAEDEIALPGSAAAATEPPSWDDEELEPAPEPAAETPAASRPASSGPASSDRGPYKPFSLEDLGKDIADALATPDPFPWEEFNAPEPEQDFSELEASLTEEEQRLHDMLGRFPDLSASIKVYNTENPPDYVQDEPLTRMLMEEDETYLAPPVPEPLQPAPDPRLAFSQGLMGALSGLTPEPAPPGFGGGLPAEPAFARPEATLNPTPEAVALCPAHLAMRALALPLRVGDEALIVASPLPVHPGQFTAIEEATGLTVRPAPAPLAEVVAGLREAYADGLDQGFRGSLLKGAAPKTEDSFKDRLLGWLGVDRKAA